MKQITSIVLAVTKNGAPLYQSQRLSISRDGIVEQTLTPMVYLGSAKTYEFEIQEEDAAEFLDSINPDNFVINQSAKLFSSSFWSLDIYYDDDSVISKSGSLVDLKDENLIMFDNDILNLIPFTEKPYLFTD